MTYVLLSGLSPFFGDTVQATFGRITGVTYDFDTEEFDNVSMDAKNFIKDLLLNKMESRMTAEECLHHPWMCSDRRVSNNIENGQFEEIFGKKEMAKGCPSCFGFET